MKNTIVPFNWRTELEKAKVDSIGHDFILVDNPNISNACDFPFKVDILTVVICISGKIKGSVNLKEYDMEGPCLLIIFPDQVLNYESISKDFKGHFILMSQQFSSNLLIDAHERFPVFRAVANSPWVSLSQDELKMMLDYYSMFLKTVRMTNNPHRVEIIRHLIQAFYLSGSKLNPNTPLAKVKGQRPEILTEKFIDLLKANFKENRAVQFYADQLCLSPKYLSKVVKESSGKSASEWIDDFVVVETKALLKSSNMTIQQISDKLNFPSQSFFGKYFKRRVGVSPKGYRKS